MGVPCTVANSSADITKPMDLSTVLRNVKTHKYKTKAEFATDLDLIWQNCLTYNTTMVSEVSTEQS